MEGYRNVKSPELNDGQEVIVEIRHWDYKTGAPVESDYYRTIVGHHRTVAGMMAHLVAEPTVEWPQIPPWQSRWIYAGNDGQMQMWVKEESDG